MKDLYQKFIYLIPSIIIFLITLSVTLKYSWPIGWDIFYHIHLSKVYMANGLTFFDPIYNAPGTIINYPPVFHLVILVLGYVLRMDLFDVARLMQPFLAALVALSVTVVASRLYEDKYVGIFAGLILFSGSIAMRLGSSLPENMALIFLPLSIFFFYEFFKDDKIIASFISGCLTGLVALIHPAATFCLVFAITFITAGLVITEFYFERDTGVIKRALKGYAILIGTAGLIASVWWLPAFYFKSLGHGGVATSLSVSRSLSILKYPDALGYFVLVLAVAGIIPAIRRFELRDRLILLWIISMFILSKSYYFGINVITYRVLIYIMIPLSILASSGLISVVETIKNKNKDIARILLIALFIFAVFQAFNNLSSSKVADYGAMTAYGRINIAPPTDSEFELAKWFNSQNEDGKISLSNYFTGGFVMAYTNRPVDSLLYEKSEIPSRDELTERGISYLVFDKRLKASGDFKFNASSSFLFYNPTRINISDLEYPYLQKIYENQDFVVYRVL